MICTDETKLITLSQLCAKVSESLEKMSPKEKAELRVKMRAYYNLPPQSEKDLWEN